MKYIPAKRPTIGHENVAGANRQRPCMAAIKAMYPKSFPFHFLERKPGRLLTECTSLNATLVAPGSSAWRSFTGFGTGRLRLSGSAKI